MIEFVKQAWEEADTKTRIGMAALALSGAALTGCVVCEYIDLVEVNGHHLELSNEALGLGIVGGSSGLVGVRLLKPSFRETRDQYTND